MFPTVRLTELSSGTARDRFTSSLMSLWKRGDWCPLIGRFLHLNHDWVNGVYFFLHLHVRKKICKDIL